VKEPYQYAAANPVLRHDRLGLAHITGTSDSDIQRRINDGINEIKAILIRFPCCSPYSQDVLDRLDSIEIHYDPDSTECGDVSGFDRWFGGNRIYLGPLSFDEGRCCGPAKVIGHEILHLVSRNLTSRQDHADTNGLAVNCFGCRAGEPSWGIFGGVPRAVTGGCQVPAGIWQNISGRP
jgi:hypothetical protein